MTYTISKLEKLKKHFLTHMKIAIKDDNWYTEKICKERIEELDKAIRLLISHQ